MRFNTSSTSPITLTTVAADKGTLPVITPELSASTDDEQQPAMVDTIIGTAQTTLQWLPKNAQEITLHRYIVNGTPVLFAKAKSDKAQELEESILSRNPCEVKAFNQVITTSIKQFAAGGTRNLLPFNAKNEPQAADFKDVPLYYQRTTNRHNGPRVFFACQNAGDFISEESMRALKIKPEDTVLLHLASVNKKKEFAASNIFMDASSRKRRRRSGLRAT